ncbi:SEC-C metal-binding domain-containing protein [Halobacillus yeomjeoni]|uniref:SEC-C domain-containing protein n=1 Tax=Halobacillus yeomjeoni TaxID=311194 RepID=A0A931HWR4_9BACI|nr:SEC-C metal-binding domain-containing protein [Halobacillus yeomjeoni]MBH0230829.1 SEC-C domain-containing protein [Halobacillus yeomjeoni]
MAKIGRNEPCPCGSGKKYKQCCRNKKVVELPKKIVKEELNQHYMQFQEYVRKHYPYLLPAHAPRTDEENIEQHLFLIYKGMVEPLEEGGTIVDPFIEKLEKTVTRPATLESLQQWRQPVVSMFELKEEGSENITVEDLFDGEVYEVTRDSIPVDHIPDSPYYLGILMKWGDVYQSMPLAVPDVKASYDQFMEAFEQEYKEAETSLSKHEYFVQTFLEQMKTWLYREHFNEFEQVEEVWEGRPKEVEVLNQLKDNVDAEVQQENAFTSLKNLWITYCEENRPTIRKAGVFAAALDYLMMATPYFELNKDVTKKEIAEKYGVSPNSITKRTKEFDEYIEELTARNQQQA